MSTYKAVLYLDGHIFRLPELPFDFSFSMQVAVAPVFFFVFRAFFVTVSLLLGAAGVGTGGRGGSLIVLVPRAALKWTLVYLRTKTTHLQWINMNLLSF